MEISAKDSTGEPKNPRRIRFAVYVPAFVQSGAVARITMLVAMEKR